MKIYLINGIDYLVFEDRLFREAENISFKKPVRKWNEERGGALAAKNKITGRKPRKEVTESMKKIMAEMKEAGSTSAGAARELDLSLVTVNRYWTKL